MVGNNNSGTKTNTMSTMSTGTNNSRKPFSTDFDNDMDTGMHNNNNKNVKSTYQNSSTTSKKPNVVVKSNTNTKNISRPHPNFNIKEVEDDRPAMAGQGKNNDLPSEYPEDDPEEDLNGLNECKSCGRKFNDEAFPKHSKICKKVFGGKVKKFDTKKQRMIDPEHAALVRYKEMEEKKKGGKIGSINNTNNLNNGNMNAKKAKWKKQSEEFRAILKNNVTTNDFHPKGGSKIGTVGKNSKTGGTQYGNLRPVNVPSVITEDYSLCNMCNRKYNEQAYTKHLPTCERRAKESLMKNKMKSVPTTTNTNSTGSNFSSKPNLNVRFNKK